MERRSFFKKFSAISGGLLLPPLLTPGLAAEIGREIAHVQHASLQQAAEDEDFWFQIRQAYTSSSNLINLNNGGVSPHPKVVQEKVAAYTRFANEAPGYYMWRFMGRLRPQIRTKLAILGGVDPEEIAITRNATEALETVIQGIDFKKGDEILTTDQDYPSILNALEMLSKRQGVKITKIALPVPVSNPSEVVKRFENAITPKTKALVCCHIINLTGQILPVQAICEMAKKHKVQTIIDGAHSFCQLSFSIADLGCDYYGTSLHKWLCGPFGTGMLYVQKDKISDLWPMFGYPEAEKDQISKFEHTGTRSFPIELAISDAIDFHNGIGTDRKNARLHYLKEYWTQQVADIPELKFHAQPTSEHTCGIINFSMEGWEPQKLSSVLVNQHRLYVTANRHKDVAGVRISPNVYTNLDELDYLVEILHKLAKNKP